MKDDRDSQLENPVHPFLRDLLSKKAEIEASIASLKENRRMDDQYRLSDSSLEELDRADNEISAQQYYSLLERKSSELKRIEKLLERIDKIEDFGWCEECGDRISHKRLSVMPDATRCISCQREYEKMESRKGYTPRKYQDSSRDMDQDEEDMDDSTGLRVFIDSIDQGAVSMDDLEEMDLGDDQMEQKIKSYSVLNNGNDIGG